MILKPFKIWRNKEALLSHKTSVYISIFLSLLLGGSPSWSQFAQRGGVEGFVFDQSGAAVPGASVNLTDLAQNQTRRETTDATGHYAFNDLPAGNFSLSVKMQGFETTTSESV